MLAIDIGNSRVKWALFEGEKIQRHNVFSYNKINFENALNSSELANLQHKVRVSCVAGEAIKSRLYLWLKANKFTDIEFAVTLAQQCEVINSYAEPAKMGVDRWLAMLAAKALFNDSEPASICIIDCGTAITLDILSQHGKHLGGLIFPGYQTMLTSLGLSTGNINSEEVSPLNASLNCGLGVSTREAVAKGCAQVISGGVNSIMNKQATQSKEKYYCVLTGGDSEWLFGSLSMPVKVEPFLILKGLYLTSLNNSSRQD